MLSGFASSVIIAIVIIIASHLTVDKDFSPTIKRNTCLVLIVITILYVIFGIFLGGSTGYD